MKMTKDQYFILPCSLLFFVLFYSLSFYWHHKGFFEIPDVFFDADPNFALASISHGYEGNGFGHQSVSHAFIELFSLPVMLMAKLVSTLFNVNDTQLLKEIIALTISPLFSSLTIYYFYKTLNLLNLKRIDAIIFCLFFCVSTTNIIFASIPETFGISCFLISYLIFSFYNAKVNHVFISNTHWFILATVIAGITITNLCIFFFIYTTHLLRNCKLNWRVAIRKSVIISVGAFSFILTYYVLSHLILNLRFGTGGGFSYIKDCTTFSLPWFARSLLNLCSASINSIIGISPEHKEYMLPLKNPSFNSVTFKRDSSNIIILAGSVLFWAAFFYYSRKKMMGNKWRDVYLISLPIIAFNFSFHTFFGVEPFLYTSHWILPLIMLFIPILHNRPKISASLLAVVSIINIYFVFHINQIVM